MFFFLYALRLNSKNPFFFCCGFVENSRMACSVILVHCTHTSEYGERIYHWKSRIAKWREVGPLGGFFGMGWKSTMWSLVNFVGVFIMGSSIEIVIDSHWFVCSHEYTCCEIYNYRIGLYGVHIVRGERHLSWHTHTKKNRQREKGRLWKTGKSTPHQFRTLYIFIFTNMQTWVGLK